MDKHRRFKAVKIALMRSEEFGLLRGVMMLGTTVLGDEVPTACTNGRDEWYNPDFLFDWKEPDKSAGFIIVHENLHKTGRHMIVYKVLFKLNARVINMATDYWINDRIISADPKERLVAIPRDKEGKIVGLYDPQYHGWTVKRIFYDILEREKDEGEGGGDSEGEGGGNTGFDEHDWEGANAIPTEEQQKLDTDIKQAIRQGIHASKKVGAGGLRDTLGLGELIQPKVDWRQKLRIFMNSTCRKMERSTWRRPNRRFLHQDVIMPSLEGSSIKEIVLARDTSGSMHWGNRLNKATSEMASIGKMLNIDKIHLIDWDGEVEGYEVYTSDGLATAPELKRTTGGGGTDPTCVSDYLDSNNIKPDCVVMLTDGEINSWGNWKVPVLWAITNDEKITAPIGQTIQID
tara:strand:+ start:1484 stop:2692 length:1209 start_codon:yes stop_codon:yes gene_type:complete